MNRKGFTLVELLVVMAVIALLSGLSIFVVDGARRSARDARRRSDLEAIRSALELYRADCNQYPPPPLGTSITGTGSCVPASQPYMTAVPTDPGTTHPAYSYTRPTTTTYTLSASLEGPPTSTLTVNQP